MTTLIASEDAVAEATSSPGGPRLRVRRAGRAEQTVSVVDGKCTIGSSPRCHVCLPAAEAKPLQCLVSLEAGVALATRWTAGVLLNGREFTRRPLNRGDRLSIGPWELVWEAPDASVEASPGLGAAPIEPCHSSVKPTPPPLDATPHPSLESPATPVEPKVVLAAPSVPATRAAAKTMLVASRPTELFVPPVAPSATAASIGGIPPAAVRTARTRAKALAAAARASRKRASELAAEVADLQTRLSTTEAAAEAQTTAHEAQLRELRTELQSATADRVRTAEAAVAATELERQIATARTAAEADANAQLAQIKELHAKLVQAEADRDRLTSELESMRTVRPKTAPPDPRLQSLSDACDAAQRKVVDLRSQLTERDELIAELRSQEAETEAARAELEQKLAAQQLQQSQWLAECQTLQRDHASALAEVVAERDELQRHVDKLAAAPAQAVSSAPAWPVVADGPTSTVSERAEVSEFTSPICTEWASEDAASASAAREETPLPAAYAAAPTELSPAISAAAEPASPIAPAPAEREFAPESFIDKYRHMLEDDDAPATPLRNSRPILDDEYLSPAKFDDAPGADDDSDEALEAYMSNMMRRVRGDGHAAPASQAPEFQVESLPQTTTAAEIVAAPPTEVAQVELDDNGMQRLARKQPISTNLAALRELANASARGAIAHHRKRRHVESAITRGGFCAVAGGTAGYLMLTAPDANSPWFWCGCAALLGAAVSGAQFVSACWQRLKYRRSNGGPTGPTTAVDQFAALAVSANDASPGGDYSA